MKVLYSIQGTGNGHLARALEIIPHLQDFCQCDILISGTQCDLELGYPVKYRLKGFSFIFGKRGGVDYWGTIKNFNPFRYIWEILTLRVEGYDLVINDFEPVSAWSCLLKGVPILGLSHQSSFLNNHIPVPEEKDHFGNFILKNYAPVPVYLGFHFKAYAKNIYTPVIRSQVRACTPKESDYYTVYLPSYDDEYLIKVLSRFIDTKWHLFSKHTKKAYQEGNISVNWISNDAFVEDMANSKGVLCGAGFETPAEALFLKKKIMVIPMKGQYEQQCNAAALEEMGVPVIKVLNDSQFEKINDWLKSTQRIEVNYPDLTRSIVRRIFEIDVHRILHKNRWLSGYKMTIEKSHSRRVAF
ncbi:MAG: glycosyltransferase family protein [Prolixibacteraceae bacterium]